MPEIKNNFSQGKMNQDLDERILPKGQYRDATNIQVATSEEAGVGAIQNILGNTRIEDVIGGNWNTVGAIADEKNNKLYWLVHNNIRDAIFEYNLEDNTTVPVIIDTNLDVLRFDGNLITGINIVDDMLMWTDNVNEPKKINIERCKLGVDASNPYSTHTKLVVNNVVTNTDIAEQHITVIKKRPSIAPRVNVVSPSGIEIINSICEFSQNNEGNFLLAVGDTGFVRIPRILQGFIALPGAFYTTGDILVLKQLAIPGSLPTIQEVRCVVTNVQTQIGNPGYTTWEVEILAINNSLPTTVTTFDGNNLDSGLEMSVAQEIDLEKRLFDTKFVRFGTRWKYEDGEYSAFSPFTEVAFKASAFSFHPTKDNFNIGMENSCESVNLTNLVTPDIPDDVVQIDILFKLENSTTVYSLDNISINDPLHPGETYNAWNANQNPTMPRITPNGTLDITFAPSTNYQGQYIITTENIYAALPANQLLRPWDNVPKKALAQEITGNRIVYGNYTQGYNMLEGSGMVKPILELGYRQRSYLDNDTITFDTGKRSIKTFKTYQLGVVYGDEYGRETPVFTSKNSSLTIPWDSDSAASFNGNASRSTQLTAVLRGTQPDFASYFKFFIKQTSGEYYNLSMDRVYRSEDSQNLWISFPSADANKIQKDEYIILKKKAESEEQVETNNKFKVVDIKTEVPDWVRLKRVTIGEVGESTIIQSLFPGFNSSINIPETGQNQIIINKDVWINNGGTSLLSIEKNFEFLEMRFSAKAGTGVIKSKRYRIVGIVLVNSDEEYKISLETPISEDDNWITTTPDSGVVNSDLKVIIQKVVYRTASADFQGRFFVKIISNNITQAYLEPLINTELNYISGGTIPAYNFADTQASAGASHNDGIANQVNDDLPTSLTTAITGANKSDTRAAWEILYQYGGSDGIVEGAFIDHCYYASAQPIDASDLTGQTGYLQTDISGRMRRGSGGPTGNYFVDSVMGLLDIDGISAYRNDVGDVTQNAGWGGRTWSYQSKGINNAVAMGSGAGDNTYDDIYDNQTSGIAYMHLSFGPVGDNLWVKGNSNEGLGNINWGSNRFPWQFIDPGSFTVGGYQLTSPTQATNNANAIHQDQWKIQNAGLNNLASKLVVGTQFKIIGSEEIFTIDDVSIKRLYNHTPFMETRNAWDGAAQISLDNSVEHAFTVLEDDKSDATKKEALANKLEDFGNKTNRRLLYILKLDKNPKDYGITFTWDADTSQSIRIVESSFQEGEVPPIVSPAIWETEIKEETDLNIYYEASDAIPITLNKEKQNSEMFAPIGSRVYCSKSNSMFDFTFGAGGSNLKFRITGWETAGVNYNIVEFASPGLNVNPDGGSGAITNDQTGWDAQTAIYSGKVLKFFKPDNSFVSAKIFQVKEIIGNFVTKVSLNLPTKGRQIGLPYYDCICFGNGVESNRIRDDFNAMTIGRGVKASTVFEGQYKEENRKNGLIYSGIYNSTSGVNNLNQFIQAEKITKDLNPTYGSIQKLFQRRIDLVTFCEDKVVKILSNKDALYNADGNSQLISTNRVLGDANPFVGDYGISKNPQSFAKETYRAYFTDKQRGAVLRLSMDGLTPISNIGMRDFFKDNLTNAETIVASYDGRNKNYNLTIDNQTISFNEDVKGWTSFKSFVQETGISVSNSYFTFNAGQVWLHHATVSPIDGSPVHRNTFYAPAPHDGTSVAPSTIRTLLNDQPETIKSYSTLNYEGDQGWVCNDFITDQQRGTVPEFIEKEGKWFNYIRGTNDVDLQAFNFQGISQTTGIEYNI